MSDLTLEGRTPKGDAVRADTDWFRDCAWGVLTHYLTDKDFSARAWSAQVADFDVDGLVEQLASVGARFYVMTIGQNSGHFCSPNATYDAMVGHEPSKCSQRDLIADLTDAAAARGIRLLVYLPSGAPAQDATAIGRLQWEWGYEGGWPHGHTVRTGRRLAAFQRRWEAIVREWSERWGRRVSGWWIDGCYFADEMYRHDNEPNFQSFTAALKAGNPDGIVAFNPGVRVPVVCHTECEDYTAGEISEALPVAKDRWVDGAQLQILSYLGVTWGQGPPRFPTELVVGYTQHVRSVGGVVTWDVPIETNGLIPQPFLQQLNAIKD
jgi:alpha-L-fucosidase-like protein